MIRTFPPEVDLGIQSTKFYNKAGRASTKRMQHIAVSIQPSELPAIIATLALKHYGGRRPDRPRPSRAQDQAFLTAVLAAISNAVWQMG
jgi:hypothetical protein